MEAEGRLFGGVWGGGAPPLQRGGSGGAAAPPREKWTLELLPIAKSGTLFNHLSFIVGAMAQVLFLLALHAPMASFANVLAAGHSHESLMAHGDPF